jgi:hypothetical protein
VFLPPNDQEHAPQEISNMARKPNYNFERSERERIKKLKKAERVEAKVKPVLDDGESVAPADEPAEK